MKRIAVAMIVAIVVSLSGTVLVVNGTQEIKVTIDGKVVTFPDANGRTLLPVRFVTEELGAKVDWKADQF